MVKRPRLVGLGVGKIPPATLARSVFPFLGKRMPSVLVRPGIGRDAAIVQQGSRILVFSTDPITGTSHRIGAHSVIVNANDIATSGARPVWYLCTLLLPPGTRESSLREIMREIDEAARSMGVAVLGGHTEVTSGLSRPLIAGFMVGEAVRRKSFSAENGHQGDRVLFTKSAGLEGTAIIARDHSDKLRGLTLGTIQDAKTFSQEMSVVKEALALTAIRGVHAMHDPTEGGVITGLWELAEASGLGIEVWAEKIRVAPETGQICSRLGLDPLKLMSSGSLLIAVQASETDKVRRRLQAMGVAVSDVGELTSKQSGRNMFRNGRKGRLRPVSRDEVYRLS